jgi:hypothetical protein
MKRHDEDTDRQKASGLSLGSEPIDGMRDRRAMATGDDDSSDRKDKGDDDSSDKGDTDTTDKGDGGADSRDADGKD